MSKKQKVSQSLTESVSDKVTYWAVRWQLISPSPWKVLANFALASDCLIGLKNDPWYDTLLNMLSRLLPWNLITCNYFIDDPELYFGLWSERECKWQTYLYVSKHVSHFSNINTKPSSKYVCKHVSQQVIRWVAWNHLYFPFLKFYVWNFLLGNLWQSLISIE